MLEVLVVAAIGSFVGGALVTAFLRMRRARRALPEHDSPPQLPPSSAPATDPLSPFGLHVGDVLQRENEDFWVTGGLVVSESTGSVAAVCCLSEHGDSAHVVIAAGQRQWIEGRAVSPESFRLAPQVVQVDGRMFSRRSMVPVELLPVGKNCVSFTPRQIPRWSVYESDEGQKIWSLSDGEQALAWLGTPDPFVQWRNLGGGNETLKEWN